MSDKTIVECMCAVMARRRVLPMIPLRNFTSLEDVADAFNSAARELDRLQADNARLREQVDAIVAWAESCDDSANNPDLDADVAHDRKESAQTFPVCLELRRTNEA